LHHGGVVDPSVDIISPAASDQAVAAETKFEEKSRAIAWNLDDAFMTYLDAES
jgi:hypothetical protein